jgi:hypothetical protein
MSQWGRLCRRCRFASTGTQQRQQLADYYSIYDEMRRDLALPQSATVIGSHAQLNDASGRDPLFPALLLMVQVPEWPEELPHRTLVFTFDEKDIALTWVLVAAAVTVESLSALGLRFYWPWDRPADEGRCEIVGWHQTASRGDILRVVQAVAAFQAFSKRGRTSDPARDAKEIVVVMKGILAEGHKVTQSRVAQNLYPHAEEPRDSLKKRLERIKLSTGMTWEDLLQRTGRAIEAASLFKLLIRDVDVAVGVDGDIAWVVVDWPEIERYRSASDVSSDAPAPRLHKSMIDCSSHSRNSRCQGSGMMPWARRISAGSRANLNALSGGFIGYCLNDE